MDTVFISDGRCPVAREIAAGFAAAGWRVALNLHQGGAPLAGCEEARVDLCRFDELTALFDALGDSLRGVIHPAPPVIHATLEGAGQAQWLRAREEGAIAAMELTRAAGAFLSNLGRGAIVYLGSVHAEKPLGNGFLYSMACAATQMLCREAALAYGPQGVCAYYVQRGFMAHDADNLSEYSNLYVAPDFRHPQERLMRPDELNGLMLFLMSDAAGALSGADLRADGGATMFYGKPRKEVRQL